MGKTTLVNTYLHGQVSESPEPTLGADLSSKQLTLKELHLSLQVMIYNEHSICNAHVVSGVSSNDVHGTDEQLYIWRS